MITDTRKSRLVRTLFIWLLALAFAQNAWAADLVWFCPNDSQLISSTSYDAQWPQARSHVQVYKFYYQIIRDSPVAELRAKFQWLRAHHIALAVEWPAMTWTENGTGFNVEGFNPVNTSQALAQKIQSAGGTLDYAAMDEPLYFGHFDSGPHAAHWPIATIATNVAANMQSVWAIFPECRVGDIEPIDAMPPGKYLAATTEWITAFQKASGHSLAFLHDDILWASGWRKSLPQVFALLASQKIPFGVIFNAAGGAGPDEHWLESAEVNLRNYNASHMPRPNHAIFQTWYPFPKAILPETLPSSFSFLVNYYFSPLARQAPPTPLYRLYSPSASRHLYLTHSRQLAYWKAHGWIQEPDAGNVYPSRAGAADLIPLYRLSGGKQDEYLTTSAREKSQYLALGYRDDGVLGYVFDAVNPVGSPLYHASSPAYQNFYTCNPDEYALLKAPTWQRSGVVCTMP